MRILIAPDSFKGNKSAADIAAAIEEGIHRFDDSIEVIKVPMADGGEGTVDAVIAATEGRRIEKMVTGPLGEQVLAGYAILGDEKTAVIEMASASGLPLVPEALKDPSKTTTYGTGELILDAIDQGCSDVIIGIGGSATNDGGMGAAQALGVRFLDKDGSTCGTGGKDLIRVASIDMSGRDPSLAKTRIRTACDVTNPFFGPKGAAYVYSPQKGADEQMVAALDAGLRHFADIIDKDLGVDIRELPGAGAAGGLGGGLVAFFGATLEPGISLVIEAVRLRSYLDGVDLVITGEGKTDFQTAYGKVPAGVAKAAEDADIPVVCLSGALGKRVEELYDHGMTALFSTANREMTLEYAITNSGELLTQAAENIVRVFAAGRKSKTR